MKKLEFKAEIAARPQQVWDTMLQPETYKEWTGTVWPGSYFEGRWEEGGHLRFISPDGSGTLAELITHRPPMYSKAVHVAVLLKGGVEDRDSAEAKNWIGTTEAYTLTENEDGTELKVEMETESRWEAMFANDWPKALAKLKEICER